MESCNSTQDVVFDLINNDSFNSQAVACFTFNQTDGKGQGGNRWVEVPNQSIAYSLAISLTDSFDLVALNKYFTLKVLQTIRQVTAKDIQIKWPNDLLYQNKKLSGLLMQVVSNSKGNRFLILGIGINANQENIQISFPHAISLRDIQQHQVDMQEITILLHQNLTVDLSLLKNSIHNSSFELSENFNRKLWNYRNSVYINLLDESIKTEIINSFSGEDLKFYISQMGIKSTDNSFNHLDPMFPLSSSTHFEKILVEILGVDSYGRLQFSILDKMFSYHHGQIRITYE
jgi:biotin-[acetyl-CoA-carboxylase] ligase BirA-like protein